MPFFAALIAASVLAVWGARRLALRSPRAAMLLALGLLAVAYALFSVQASQGEGAAAGVGIVWVGSWYLGGVSLLLVLTLLGTAAWRHSSTPAKLLFLVVVPAAAILLVRRFRPRGSTDTHRAATAGAASRTTRTAGYVWALDGGILADSSCHGETQEFVAGCLAGAARNRTSIRR